MNLDPRLLQQVEEHPFPLLFATISGSHLYGFPSADSDFDLRGVHVLPLRDVVGLKIGRETVDKTGFRDGLEIDLVTHDVKKFMGLMLKKNGYVLEQLHSPHVVSTSPYHEELKSAAKDCVTKHHAHHYLGFSATQWKLFHKETPRRVKPLLYVFRVLLTGIHLVRTGEVEANLLQLNEEAKLPFIPELLERKMTGPEKATLAADEIDHYEREYARLVAELESAYAKSPLPETPSAAPVLNDLLLRVRGCGA
jgi:predicted nucleotidyltransferase